MIKNISRLQSENLLKIWDNFFLTVGQNNYGSKIPFLLFFQRRERVEREVKRLREEISVKKTAVTTATKGIPANKIEVRPQDQQPNYSGPTTAFNPMLVGLSNEAQLILATSLGTTGM